jgi:hypothetical protein
MSEILTFDIDLNMLRGDRVRSHIEFVHGAEGRLRAPEAGEMVWALDEDGARYQAVLERVHQSGFVELRLKLNTRWRAKAEPQPMRTSVLYTATAAPNTGTPKVSSSLEFV